MNEKMREINTKLQALTKGKYGLFQPARSIDLFKNYGSPMGEDFVDCWLPENFTIAALCETLTDEGETEVAEQLKSWAGLNL